MILKIFIWNSKLIKKTMKRNDSDDEGDSCVLIGTPLVDLLPGNFSF